MNTGIEVTIESIRGGERTVDILFINEYICNKMKCIIDEFKLHRFEHLSGKSFEIKDYLSISGRCRNDFNELFDIIDFIGYEGNIVITSELYNDMIEFIDSKSILRNDNDKNNNIAKQA